MKQNLKKILLVAGTFSDEGGKSSFFGTEIFAVFSDFFGSVNVTCFNGGTYELLEKIITFPAIQILLNIPHEKHNASSLAEQN